MLVRKQNIDQLFTKLLSYFLAFLLTFSNCFTSYVLASNIVPDQRVSGNRVYIDKSANGRTVVNINDPNGAGVSHNHFIDFNVGSSGAIINNSAVNTVSQIGGVVHGNSNLNSSANTIINEVTGTGRSQINGVQEILGKSANYILANPNGITLIGGEFINVNSATLTTGKIGLNSLGQLEKFLIEKGDIEIDGVDIDVSNLDHFDIIARSVKLNTAIYARKDKKLADSKNTSLQVVVGSGEYDVKNQKLTKGKAGPSVPSFSIDSSKLGGLYAGKIKLVSSEDGVGVNLPDIQATTGSVEITADGKIVHKNISSPRKTKIKSQNDKIVITKDCSVSSEGDFEYQSKKGIEIEDRAKIVSQGSISLQSLEGKVLNKGRVIAGGKKGISIASKGLQNNALISTLPGTLGGITINSSDTIVNNGLIQTDLNFATIFANGFQNLGEVKSNQA